MVPLFFLTNIPKQRKRKVKMVSTRFNSFVLGLVFIFLALRDSQSVSYTHKAKEKMVMVMVITDGNAFVAAGETPSILQKENIDAVAVPNAVVEANINGKLGGRKMMEKMVLGKEMVVKEEGMKIGGAPKISGANRSVRNCNHRGKGKLNIECKLRASRSSHPVKVEEGGFMAFSADYNVPKSHPPKNN